MTDLKQSPSTLAVATQKQPSTWTRIRRTPWMNHGGLIVVLLIVSTIAALGSDVFLTPFNLLNILKQVSVLAVLAAGLTLLMTSGGVDFSMGSNAAVAASVLAVLISAGVDPMISLVVSLVLSTLIGAVNGVVVTFVGVEPFVVTLATATILDGAKLFVLQGKTVSAGDTFRGFGSGTLFGIPWLTVTAVIVCVAIGLVMRYTVFGRNIFAIGGNEEVAKLSGIPVSRNKMMLYSLNGLLSGVAGFMLIARVGAASPSLGGLGIELQAVAAVVIGGTALAGGYGTMVGTVLGVLLLGVMSNALNLLHVDDYYQTIAVGAVLLIAAIVGRLQRRNRR